MVAPKSTPTTGAITAGSSLVVNRPSNVAEGDILTAWIKAQGNGTPDATPPAGWTRVGVEYDGASGGRILSMFVKEATSSEPETYTFTVTTRAIGVIAVWDGNEVEIAVTGHCDSYRGAWDNTIPGRRMAAYSVSAPSLSFVYAGNIAVEGLSHVPTYKPPTYTELVNDQTGSGTTGSREAIWVGYKEVTGGTVASEAIGWQDGTTSGDSIQGTSLRVKSNEPQGYPIQVGEVEARLFVSVGGELITPVDVYATPTVDAPNAVVAIYNGTTDGADDIFYDALGPALGAGVSYYTPNAKVGGTYVLRSWDLTRISRGYVPYIHLQSVAWNDAAGANVQYYPWQKVAEGEYDTDFAQMANALKDCPPGTAFAFDGEPEVRLGASSHQPVPNPNSPTTSWPEGWPQNGDGYNTPAWYAAAQRRIYEVMHPIAPNLDYRFWFAGHERSTYMESFYPGDEYVTSIGIDPYVWAHNPGTTTPYQKYEPIVSWIRSRSWGQGKPIGISETGIDTGHTTANQVNFWSNMPSAVRDLNLAYITFYCRSNWQITPTSNPTVWDAYVEAMQEIAGV